MNERVGVIYTETVVHAAPTKFSADAPYQLAVIDLSVGPRTTGRILPPHVKIGDRVRFVEDRDGVPYYQAIDPQP